MSENDKNEIVDNLNEVEKKDELNVSNSNVVENENVNLQNPENIIGDNNIKLPNEKKKGKKVLILIIILLLIACGVGGYFLYKKYNKTEKIDTQKSVTKSEYRLSGNSLENFDLYFLQLENTKENKIYSPLSIKYALAMLQEGANGETREQITNLIGDYKPKAYTNSDHMSFANAMFIRNTFKDHVKEEYTKNLHDKYNAEVILDDFASPDNINNWVSNKTFNLVNNLLDDVSENNFFLINALAIDMNWNNLIQCAYGSKLPCRAYSVHYAHEDYSDYVPFIEQDKYPSMNFNNNEGIKSVKIGASLNNYDIVKELGEENIKKTIGDAYQSQVLDKGNDCGPKDEIVNKFYDELAQNYKNVSDSTDFYMYNNENIKVFAKDLQEYDGVTLQYVGIMPINTDLTEYIKNLDAKQVNEVIGNLKEIKLDNFKDGVITKINGSIPLFKYDYDLKLMDDLKTLGIKNVFDINKSDLSNMISKEKQYINKAIHKADIEFSNEGIKAAAATAMGGAGASKCWDYEFDVPVEEIDLTFDKPYMYIIRDKATGEVWFTGTVYNPITQ